MKNICLQPFFVQSRHKEGKCANTPTAINYYPITIDHLKADLNIAGNTS